MSGGAGCTALPPGLRHRPKVVGRAVPTALVFGGGGGGLHSKQRFALGCCGVPTLGCCRRSILGMLRGSLLGMLLRGLSLGCSGAPVPFSRGVPPWDAQGVPPRDATAPAP